MKLIIFIGHFKTGSTSIQSFLSSNYYSLLRAGILYPSVESRGVSHNLRALAEGKDRPTARAGLNVIEPHNALALRLKNEEDGHGVPHYYPNLPSGFQMLEMIVNQINSLEPKITILCSEVFALLGMTRERKSIQRLQNRFAQHDVTIYCNLRRPDEHISSWHRQRLKFKEKLNRLDSGALPHYLETAHFQYARMIRGWMDHFPHARVVVREFEDVKAAGGSVKDFVQTLEIPIPENVSFPAFMNPSIPSAFAEIGRRAIFELPEQDATQVVDWLIGAGKRIKHHSDGDVEVFGQSGREIMLDRFRTVSDELKSLRGRRYFSQVLEDIGVVRTVDDITAAEYALPDLRADARKQNFPQATLEWLGSLRLQPTI